VCFLRKTGAECTQSLSAYCNEWIGSIPDIQQLCTIFGGYPLSNTLALYELLEDLQTDVVISCMTPGYRADLPPNVHTELKNVMKDHGQGIPAKHLAVALRRLCYRYLNPKRSIAENPTKLMREYLQTRVSWPIGTEFERFLHKFPASLRLSHAFHAYTECVQRIAEEKSQESMSDPGTRKPRPGLGLPVRQRPKIALKNISYDNVEKETF